MEQNVRDVDVYVDFRMFVELIAVEKGYTLDRETIERMQGKLVSIFRESGQLHEAVSDAIDLAVEDWGLVRDLTVADLVEGEMYQIKDVPYIHHRLRKKKVKYLGVIQSGLPLIELPNGERLSLPFGAGSLVKAG